MPRKRSRGRRRKSAFVTRRRRVLIVCGALLLVGLGGWIAWLDWQAVKVFRDRHMVVPTHVYSRPLEWFPGSRIKLDDAVRLLAGIGYRQRSNITTPGSYLPGTGFVDIHTRPFRYAEGNQDAQKFRIHFKKSTLARIERLPERQESPVVLLDPIPIGTVQTRSHQDRRMLKLHEVPDGLLKTLLLVEDRHFSTHYGIDPWAIARAMWSNFRSGRVHQGGSTITQQLVKNLYLSSERTLTRKLKEAFYSLLLEIHFEKHEILEAYINEVFLAQAGTRAIHGFSLASSHFFGRELAQLEPQDFALLVGMVKAPSTYNPHRNPEAALQRRNLVLRILRDAEDIDERQYRSLVQKPLGVVLGSSGPRKAYAGFLDLVRRQLGDTRTHFDDGTRLILWSTLEPQIQEIAQSVLSKGLENLEASRGMEAGTLQGAIVVLRAENGQVLSLVSDRRAGYAGFNRALDAHRQVGSLLKPMVVLSAMENNSQIHLGTEVSDEPLSLKQPDGSVWEPGNYDKEFHGRVSVLESLERSYNVATARLGVASGTGNFVSLLTRLGLQEQPPAYPSALLGAIEISPFEVARLYLPFASGGLGFNLRAFVSASDEAGRTRLRHPSRTTRLIAPEYHFLVDYALKSVVTRGTASQVMGAFGKTYNLAGKTGTTDDFRDSWFAGYSGNYLVVVWIGRDDNRPMGLSGSTGALKIWRDLMTQLPLRPASFEVPDKVDWRYLNPDRRTLHAQQCDDSLAVPVLNADGVDTVSCQSGVVSRVLDAKPHSGGRLKKFWQRLISSGGGNATDDTERNR